MTAPDARSAGAPTIRRRRSDLTATVRTALTRDFRRHGKAAIEALREKDPAAYIKLCASLPPLEEKADSGDPMDNLTTEQLHGFIGKLDRLLALAGRTGAGATDPQPTGGHGDGA